MKRTLILAALLASCGNGNMGPGYGPPYATLHGRITATSVAVTSPDVRVALVWELVSPQPGSSALKVAQELGVRAQFPVEFQVDVARLPPAEAMNQVPPGESNSGDFDPGFRFAMGSLLVYEDTNGNGALDLVQLGGTPVDRVLGAPQDILVFYIEGPPPPAAAFHGLQLARGFNLLRQPIYTADPASCDPPQPAGDWALLDLSTTIEIALTARPELARLLCDQDSPSGGGGTACHDPASCPFTPPPAGANVCCAADGLSVQYKRCSTSSLCAPFTCVYQMLLRDPATPPPAGWPCN